MGTHSLPHLRPPPTVTMFKALSLLLVFFSLSDSIHLRFEKRSAAVSLAICANGNRRSCTCTDGSLANMDRNPCSNGHNMDQKTCECPEGFTKQAGHRRTHSLHPICNGTSSQLARPVCKCSDGSTADWAWHPCGNGTNNVYHPDTNTLVSCSCQEE